MGTAGKISAALLSAAAVAGFGSAVADAAIPEAAFHAQGGTLWTANPNVNSNLPMAAGSGASAVKTGTGTYEVAFTYSNGKLVTYGSMPLKGWPLGVAAGTTPSIASAPGGYTVAVNGSNTHYLWTGTVNGSSSSEANWSIVLPAKASPSVASGTAASPNGPVPVTVVAFRTTTNHLEFADSLGDRAISGSTVAPGSNPSIATNGMTFRAVFSDGSAVLTQQAFTPLQTGLSGTKPAVLSPAQRLSEPVAADTSPSVAWAAIGGASDEQIAYVAPSGVVHSWSNSVDTNWNVTAAAATSATIGFTDLTLGSFGIAYSTPTDVQLGQKVGSYELGFATSTQCAKTDLTCRPEMTTHTTSLGIAAGTSPTMTVR